MPEVSIRIPQIGEGLQEARLVAVLKAPGDMVARDEPIYQMETDKAVMDVESPYDGRLVKWLHDIDSIIPIGDEIALLEVDGEIEIETGSPHGSLQAEEGRPAPVTASRRLDIPPRTRAYAKEKGLSEESLANIPAAKGKLMPSDIDAFLESGSRPLQPKGYSEKPLSAKQRVLNSRMVRGNELIVPGTISVVCRWEAIEGARHKVKESSDPFKPSSFTMFAYAIAKTVADFPQFRSSLPSEETLRTYDHVTLGIAVALPGDELVVASIEEADRLNWREFAEAAKERIELARSGQDQANEAITISITNMQAFGLRDAVPVVVPPSMGTLYLGEVYSMPLEVNGKVEFGRFANLWLTFDHRLCNGVGAAQFLTAIRDKVENIESLLVT